MIPIKEGMWLDLSAGGKPVYGVSARTQFI